MKVLMIANNANGLIIFRGMLIKQLLTDGWTVIVVCPGEGYQRALTELGVVHVDLPIARRSINPFNDLKLLLSYLEILVLHKPSIVVTYTVKCNIWGGFAARLLRLPYVVNITGLGTAFQKKGFVKNAIIILYKFALLRARTVFFENEDNLRIFRDLGMVSEQRAVLVNGAGVDLEFYKPIALPDEDTVRCFLMIGRVMREKGIEELIWAATKLKANMYKFKVVVIGELEENYSSRFSQLNATANLSYEGVQKDVRPYISNSHAVVLPSHHEGMSNALLEAAACGRPIIASNIPGCREIVIENVTGFLVEKGNAMDLYEKMAQFCSLKMDQISKMGSEARIHVERNFDKEAVVQETMKYLKFCNDGV